MQESTPEAWLPTRETPLSLAQRIGICMDLGRPDRGRPWSQQAVREALAEHGAPVSQSYFSELCRGERKEPSLGLLRAMARVFGVPTAYFASDDHEAAQIELSLRAPEQVRRQAIPVDTPGSLRTLSDRIDRCFRFIHPPGREFTYREVSDGVNLLGAKMSASYLAQLRKGERDNPTVRQIEALSRFFHIPATYFLETGPEVERIDAQMELDNALRTPGIANVALRATTLNTEGLRFVASMLETAVNTPAFQSGSPPVPPEPAAVDQDHDERS